MKITINDKITPIVRPFLIALILTAVLGMTSCSNINTGSGEKSQATPTLPATPITVSSPKMVEAQVVPLKNATLSFSITGIVEEVYVKEGDLVKEGTILARLKGQERIKAAIAQAELQVLNAKQELDRLNEKAKVEASEAAFNLAKAQTELKNAQENRDSMNYRQTKDSDIDTLHANLVLAEDGLKTAQRDYDGVKDRADGDLVKAEMLTRLSAARQKYDRALYNFNEALKKPDANAVGEAEARLVLAKASLEYAQLRYNKLKNGPDPEKLELQQTNLRNAQAQLASAQANLNDLELKAPFSGTVIAVQIEKGETTGLSPAIALADISGWKLETTDLTEKEVVGIKIGSRAQVTIDAIPDLKLSGKVSKINQLGKDRQGDIVYTLQISLDNIDPRLLWNMTAFVIIDDAAQAGK
ncbi:MAG TPA: efflux RND transporter periplasmic adaptor subunit [Anaerolineaceae bacterium]